ncbi:MAG TPA: hypothetical protein VE090_02045 [Methylomirabilota bacterium]|nr:hypothetical protein [Methylomirabilota bacterium]
MTNLPSNPKPQYDTEGITELKKLVLKYDESKVIKKLLEIVEKNKQLTKDIKDHK